MLENDTDDHQAERDVIRRLQSQVERMLDALTDIIGHGVTLPTIGMYSRDYSQGYARGVDSQRRIANDCIDDLKAWHGDDKSAEKDCSQEEVS